MDHPIRLISKVYVPDVQNRGDPLEFEQLFKEHILRKRIMKSLLTGAIDSNTILEAMEYFVGTENMDAYIEETDRKLDLILPDNYDK